MDALVGRLLQLCVDEIEDLVCDGMFISCSSLTCALTALTDHWIEDIAPQDRTGYDELAIL